MSWTLNWHPAAIHGFMRLSNAIAERLDAAVLRFARTSRGPVQRVSQHDDRRVVLTVKGAVAYIYLDYEEGVIRIGRVVRRD